MADCMEFPKTVDEFMESYKVVDTEGIYMSSGCELVPVFRMKQWFEHLPTIEQRKTGNERVNDQTAKADAGKPKLTLVPRKILYAIARIREYGTAKYGDPENWRSVEIERYRDAAFRHFMAYLDDPAGVDEESGLPHLWHLACNLAFLCEMEQEQS